MKVDILGTPRERFGAASAIDTPTDTLPMPKSLMGDTVYPARCQTCQNLPVLASSVQAGFPSPAEDYVEGSLDLNEHLIRHPAATFIVRVEGESMRGAGIFPGDLLVVDRSVEPRTGHVVIAVVQGELTVKRLHGHAGQWSLIAEHPDFPPIRLNGGGEPSSIWGVVTSSVRRLDHGL